MQHASKAKPNNPLFLTVEEAAALLGISRTLAYELTRRYLITHESGLPCLRLGSRRIVVPRRAIDEMVNGCIGRGTDDGR
jgi:excisionase family DNA binding protein